MQRSVRTLLGTGLLLAAAACGENTVVQNTPIANRPPRILTVNPNVATPLVETPPDLQVVIGDLDGVDDIAAVFVECDSILIHRIMARPSQGGTSGCLTNVYAPNDTLPITAFVPRVLPGFGRVAMQHVEGGLFQVAAICSSRVSCECGPCLRNAGPALASLQWSGCIASSQVDALTLLPPAIRAPTNVFITYLEAEYRGLRATVYDASGATDTARIANVRMLYQTVQERTVAP